MQASSPTALNRRQFVVAQAAVAAALVLGLDSANGQVRSAGIGTAGGAPETGFNPFLRIGSDGSIVVIVPQAEMGQGITTSLPMLVAEELDAPWERVQVRFAPADKVYTNRFFGLQATGGSLSHRVFTEPMRKAGATARAMLVSAAAQRWSVAPQQCSTAAGQVTGPAGQVLAYGDLAAEAAALPVPADVPLKSSGFRLIGQDRPRLDSRLKSTGQARFGMDVRLPGMLTAVVLRPPVMGQTLGKVDAAAARRSAGVKQVLTIDGGVAVLATGYWQALKGRERLKAQWTAPAAAPVSTDAVMSRLRTLATTPSQAPFAKKVGTPDEVAAAKTVEALYEAPYLAHAAMEPLNCTVWVQDGKTEVWGGFQNVGGVQQLAAKLTGQPLERVTVYQQFLGGGFGRRFSDDFVREALQIGVQAKAPVKLVYSREDDLRAQHYRPPAAVAFKGKLDAQGRLLAVTAKVASPSVAHAVAEAGAPLAVVNNVDIFEVESIADMPYDIPNFSTQWERHEPGIKVFVWRSVGHSKNTFFMEGFVDELAHAAGQDPYEFRRALLSQQPRYRGVLELAAQKAGWGQPLPAGRARGISVGRHYGSYVAEVVEASLQGGKVKVEKVVCAIDCGLAINPLTIRAQVESAVLYGMSAALWGDIQVRDGQVVQSNFHDYPVVRMDQVPPIEVHIVPDAQGVGGVGEPGLPSFAPALVNAVFALTGQRIRSLPLSKHGLA